MSDSIKTIRYAVYFFFGLSRKFPTVTIKSYIIKIWSGLTNKNLLKRKVGCKMGYRCNVAITMLQKDLDELREFVKTIKDEYTQGEFNFDSESPSEVRGVKAVTLFRDECYWRPESEDAWAGILMRFLNGDKENEYDDGLRPYKITVLGLDDIEDQETFENRVDYGGIGELDNMLPYEAAPYVRREFAFYDI